MPCQDHEYGYGIDYQARGEMKRRLDELARLLCSTCKFLDRWPKMIPRSMWPPEVVEWWGKHQKLDKAREQRTRR